MGNWCYCSAFGQRRRAASRMCREQPQVVLRPPDSRHASSHPVPRRAASGTPPDVGSSALIDDPGRAASAFAVPSIIAHHWQSLVMLHRDALVMIVENLIENMETSSFENHCRK